LPRSIQSQKEMAAREGTILDDSHGFVMHRHYANRTARVRVGPRFAQPEMLRFIPRNDSEGLPLTRQRHKVILDVGILPS
jgi:hypothetical protein